MSDQIERRVRACLQKALDKLHKEGLNYEIKEALYGEPDPAKPSFIVTSKSMTAAKITRTSHHSEGSGYDTINIDLFADTNEEAIAKINAWLLPLLALIKQDEEIAQAGYDPTNPPAIYYQCHPFVRAVIEGLGLNADKYVAPNMNGSGFPIQTSNGIMTDDVVVDHAGYRVRIYQILDRRQIKVESMSFIRLSDNHAVFRYWDNNGKAEFQFHKTQLSDTMISFMRDKRLSDLLEIEGLTDLGEYQIKNIYNDGVNGFKVEIPYILAPLVG